MEQELSHGQTNVENQSSTNYGNEELIQRKEIEGTPFVAIKDEKGWFITMGQYKLTEGGNTIKEIERIIKGKGWEFLTNVISVIVTEINKETKKQK